MSIVLFALFAISLAVAVGGVVAMGVAGKGRDKHPRLASRFAQAADALNGDSEPPQRFVKNVELVNRYARESLRAGGRRRSQAAPVRELQQT